MCVCVLVEWLFLAKLDKSLGQLFFKSTFNKKSKVARKKKKDVTCGESACADGPDVTDSTCHCELLVSSLPKKGDSRHHSPRSTQ